MSNTAKSSTTERNIVKIRDTQGIYHAVYSEVIIGKAVQCIRQQFNRGKQFCSTEAAKDYIQVLLGGREQEVFTVLFLDSQHRILACEEMFYGTIDGASVYPREVIKAALKHNAAAVILAHNHPSGDPTASQADIQITNRLKEALSLLDVRVLDHIIAGSTVSSMAEQGLL